MKTMKKNLLLRLGLSVAAAACSLFCIGTITPNAEVAEAAPIARYLYIGDVIEAKDYKMQSGVYAEGMKIVYPTGGIYGSEKFVIEQAGQYQVTYYATVDGNLVEETKTYMVIRRPQDMIVADGLTVDYGKFYVESPYELKKEQYGAKVHMKAGAEITFATNLKVEELTKDFNFLEMIVQPSVYGETDFENMTVRLTDSADANNYVEYFIQTSNIVDGAGMTSYVRGGASGTLYGGYENGIGSKYHTSGFYGTSVFHSFRGWSRVEDDFNNKTVSESPMTLALDHESKQMFIGPQTNTWAANKMMNDLDDPAKYKSDPWAGFKGDEVSVTIKAGGFSKAEGILLIKSFGGYNLANDVVDTKAPSITFDYDMTDRLPVAEVGTNFPIIPFMAKDVLDKTVKTNVWVNHINANGKKITVPTDGKTFYVEYEGQYEIIYRAEDYSGNATEERIEITAQADKPNIYIGIEEPLVEVDVYESVYVPYVADMNIYGGSGTLITDRAVYSPSKKLLTIKDKLELTELGDYKVVYTATDYYGNVGYGVVTIRSQEIAAPKFVQEPEFTDMFIKGFNYKLPEAFVIETVNGELISLACQTYVNGNLVTGSFVADGTEVAIRYVAEGATGTVEWSDTISVVDVEKGRYKSRYFYTADTMQVIDQQTNLEFAFSDNAQATFVNAISSSSVAATFSYEASKANFSEMRIIIQDAANSNLSVTVTFFYDQASNTWLMQMNDSNAKVAYGESKGTLTFSYSAKNYQIIDTNGEAAAIVNAYDNGDEFKGFSDAVYITFEFAGVSRATSFYLEKLSNQTMGYNKSAIEKAVDEIKPLIVLDDVFLLRQKIGTKANIPTAEAFDVLGQIAEFTVTVEMGGKTLIQGPANEPVDFLLDKAGYYNVTYFAKDTNGNKTSLPYMILVSDETAPELSVTNNLSATYNVGAAIAIPTYSATDNNEKLYIQVMVVLPNNEMRLLHYVENDKVTSLLSRDSSIYDSQFKVDDNTFVAETAGTYTLRFIAFDEYYNYTVQEIDFQVK